MGISYQWTNGQDPDFQRFYRKTEAYYSQLVGGEENRRAFIPYNCSESVADVLIAYDGGAAVGCAGLKPYAKADIEIKRVWIEPAYRRKHIALDLMRRLETKAREKGFGRMILQTRAIMTDAVGLYTKLGFHIIPNYPPYDRLEGAICFAKDL